MKINHRILKIFLRKRELRFDARRIHCHWISKRISMNNGIFLLPMKFREKEINRTMKKKISKIKWKFTFTQTEFPLIRATQFNIWWKIEFLLIDYPQRIGLFDFFLHRFYLKEFVRKLTNDFEVLQINIYLNDDK